LDRQQNKAALTFIKNELIPAFAQQRLDGAIKVHVFGSGKIPNGLLSGTDINFVGAVSDPGLYIRGADVIIVPIRNASGLKLRMIESLACGKPVVATPEAVEGLPPELRAMIYVADTADGFVETLKGIRAGTLPNKANPSVVLRHMQGDSIDEVVNHALKKTPKALNLELE
jgi:glycosyltransferase involved in cell wall biosynthesis